MFSPSCVSHVKTKARSINAERGQKSPVLSSLQSSYLFNTSSQVHLILKVEARRGQKKSLAIFSKLYF